MEQLKSLGSLVVALNLPFCYVIKEGSSGTNKDTITTISFPSPCH